MSYRYIDVHTEGAVQRVTLNRPDVRNAFNEHVIDELTRWAKSVHASEGVRVVVLAGAGPVFCAGADVTWMARMMGYSHQENVRDAGQAARMFLALDTLPVPLIGRIHGAALGGGAGLAAVCDIVVADDRAVFAFTEVKLGIVPAVISPYAIAKIGRSAARELFLTGARFSAARAREIGLVHAVVPASELDPTVGAYVGELLTSGPQAASTAKSLIQQVWAHSAAEAMTLTAETLAARRVSAEGQEGLKAFLEKRPPDWSS
jgi:methylglutaconyl-CoA hydratase